MATNEAELLIKPTIADDLRPDMRRMAQEAERMAQAEAAGRAHLFAPAGTGAVAVGRVGGVPAQAGDDREDVLAVGIDADPGAAAPVFYLRRRRGTNHLAQLLLEDSRPRSAFGMDPGP